MAFTLPVAAPFRAMQLHGSDAYPDHLTHADATRFASAAILELYDILNACGLGDRIDILFDAGHTLRRLADWSQLQAAAEAIKAAQHGGQPAPGQQGDWQQQSSAAVARFGPGGDRSATLRAMLKDAILLASAELLSGLQLAAATALLARHGVNVAAPDLLQQGRRLQESAQALASAQQELAQQRRAAAEGQAAVMRLYQQVSAGAAELQKQAVALAKANAAVQALKRALVDRGMSAAEVDALVAHSQHNGGAAELPSTREGPAAPHDASHLAASRGCSRSPQSPAE
ncbi:hypothetical protein MNEG_1618 [Monoraphidium neglectum]|uniref:Uncharacterized protein n=1 Tax=Monoraphidium neglectum TaxID=145388 RepID=A0A0D2NPI1_9CHLO|nr:hypothetical protein MNEG_1618 [Monoraphidium neglectum]KIZ06336.1 hypothetical protein MNEG_1618 [Monoraphidium neglectum]|eukprot:XP_013905355.1 hypothetical protein MNEG_1618 [Monoraphidium neglectum]